MVKRTARVGEGFVVGREEEMAAVRGVMARAVRERVRRFIMMDGYGLVRLEFGEGKEFEFGVRLDVLKKGSRISDLQPWPPFVPGQGWCFAPRLGVGYP